MALGLVGRKSFIPFVVCVAASLAQGCFTTKGDDDDSSKGCTKDTDCAAGRICNNGTCMNQDDVSGGTGGSSGSGSILSGGTGGTGISSGGSGTGGSKGGSGGSATGGSANAGSGGTSGSSNGGTAGADTGGSAGMCSESDPATCPSTDSMTFCLNGAETTLTCDYFCTTLGFTSGPCEADYGCQCGDTTDQPCTDGVNAYCSCVSGTSKPCDQNDPNNDPLTFYVDCHANDPSQQADNDFLKCLGMQLPSGTMLSTSVCQDAAVACGATPPDRGTGGSGGTGGSAGAPPTP